MSSSVCTRVVALAVALFVSVGCPSSTVVVPNLVGMPQTTAEVTIVTGGQSLSICEI